MNRHADGSGSKGGETASAVGEREMRLRIWPEEEFLARRDDYQDLLHRSDADRLFMSWEWLVEWWLLHKEPYGLRLRGYAVEDEFGRLLGMAPMTVRSFRHRGGIVGTRLEPLGNLAKAKEAALTEYVTFPVDRIESSKITRLLARSVLTAADWDDLCLSFVPLESDTWRILVDHEAGSAPVYVRPADHLVARRLDLKSGFDAFLAGLGAKTRLRVYNGRKRLAQFGPTKFVVADNGNFEECMAVHDQLYSERWGVSAFLGPRGKLYRRLAERALADGSLSLCYLAVGGQPWAAALNLRRDGREYGIQLASSRKGAGKVSPGFLQLGFMIQRCCEDGIRYFDFLAGEGGEGDYRKHFGGASSELGSVHIVRKRTIAFSYRSVDWSRALRNRITELVKFLPGRRDAAVQV